MKYQDIDLSIVYDKLDLVLGRSSFLATNLIRRVIIVKDTSRLGRYMTSLLINSNGDLLINEKFCDEFIDSENDLTVLLLHEIYHPILGDFSDVFDEDKKDPEYGIKLLARNVAMDARINACHAEFYDFLKAKEVYRNLYLRIEEKRKEDYNTMVAEATEKAAKTNTPVPNIKPYTPEILYKFLYVSKDNASEIAKEISPKAAEIYSGFYGSSKIHSHSELYNEVLEYLRKNKDKYEDASNQFQSLGSGHDQSPSEGEGEGEEGNPEELEGLTKEQIEELKDKIIENLKNSQLKKEATSCSKTAGHSTELAVKLIEQIEGFENQKISSAVLKKLKIKSIAHNILKSCRRREGKWVQRPVIPSQFSRTDIVRISSGMFPLLWKTKKYITKFDPVLVPIYFDVSGSMDQYIPKILDLILNMDDRIEHIWCFSDYVVKHTLDQLIARAIQTTGGTNFNSVVSHAVSNKFKNILVITDGVGSVSHSGKHPEIESVVTILTDHCEEKNWFSQCYENTHKLDEVIEE